MIAQNDIFISYLVMKIIQIKKWAKRSKGLAPPELCIPAHHRCECGMFQGSQLTSGQACYPQLFRRAPCHHRVLQCEKEAKSWCRRQDVMTPPAIAGFHSRGKAMSQGMWQPLETKNGRKHSPWASRRTVVLLTHWFQLWDPFWTCDL